MSIVPVTATGVSWRTDASRVFGTSFTQGLSLAIICSISASGTSRLSLIVSAWLWQRIAPTRTHRPIDGRRLANGAPRPRILFVSAPPFHSSRLVPSPRSASIHGIRLPPSGTPKLAVSSAPIARWLVDHEAVDLEDRRRRVVEQRAHFGVERAVLRQQFAHVLRAAAGGRLVGRARHPLDEVGLEQGTDAHQHAAHRAVAADVVAHAARERLVDHAAGSPGRG